MEKKNIAVLFGGKSSEYGVSLISAGAVLKNIDREKFNPVMIGITRQGDWYRFSGPMDKIEEDSWFSLEYCTKAVVSQNTSDKGLLVFEREGVREIPLDGVFPVLHGKNGEDGTVQGVFALAGIPVVGCGVLASALSMDKDRAHKIAASYGVRVPKSFVMNLGWTIEEGAENAAELGYPLFVKPVKAGSSFGVSKVMAPKDFPAAVKGAFEHDDEVIVEENIEGFEVGCAVMGREKLITGAVDEIELAEGFFDYREKYNLITAAIHLPARISRQKQEEIRRTARIIYRALGCDVFARVDMFLTPGGDIVFNEVNTIPGFTAHSRFPSMMGEGGYTFREIISLAIETAVGI